MVLEMIRDLPAHSRWAAWFHDPDRGDEFRERFNLDQKIGESEEEHQVNWYSDARTWNIDRTIWAYTANRLADLVVLARDWPKGKAPEFDTIGPASWRGEEPRKQQDKPRDKMAEAMALFGYVGPVAQAGPKVDDGSQSSIEQAMAAFGH